MRKSFILLGLSGLLLAGAALAQGSLPYWAYPVPKPAPGPAAQAGQHRPQEPARRQEALHRGRA